MKMKFPLEVEGVVVNSMKELIALGETNAEAQNILGEAFFVGNGVPRDIIKARKYLTKAIEQNNTQAMLSLGYMYQKGIGCKRNVLEAEKLYLKAESLGDDEALEILTNVYLFGMGDVKQDTVKGFNYLDRAIQKGRDVSYLLKEFGMTQDECMGCIEMIKAGLLGEDELEELSKILESAQPAEYKE